MFIGYARVSTHEQSLSLQLDALKKAGCQKIFDDKVSGAGSERPGLEAALKYVREGDTLLVWRLDRLGRSFNRPRCVIMRVADLSSAGLPWAGVGVPGTAWRENAAD
jgi:DNA invertase Pin-like site-specific DNA recombinase